MKDEPRNRSVWERVKMAFRLLFSIKALEPVYKEGWEDGRRGLYDDYKVMKETIEPFVKKVHDTLLPIMNIWARGINMIRQFFPVLLPEITGMSSCRVSLKVVTPKPCVREKWLRCLLRHGYAMRRTT